MKHTIILGVAALLCGTAFAQAPAGVLQRPAAESNATESGGKPAAKAQMKTDAKTGMPMASGGTMGMGMDMKAMDTNGDGMISKREFDQYHAKMWKKMMVKGKNGMISMSDMEAMMKSGPN